MNIALVGRLPILLVGILIAARPAGAANPQRSEQAPPRLSLVQTIPLPQITGGMNHFDADAKRERFFLTGTSDKQVLVIDLKNGKVLRTIATAFSPAAARYAPDLNLLCISGGGGVSLDDGDSFEPLAKIELASAVDELQYEPQSHKLYAGIQDSAAPAIGVIDLSAHKLLTKIKLPKSAQGFVLEERGARLFANTPGADQVTVIDRDKQVVVAEWKLTEAQSNFPAALDEKNHRLFVGCRRPARLLVFDPWSGKAIASAEIGEDTDDMSFDPATRRIYLACGGNALSVSDRYHMWALRTLPPDHFGAGDGHVERRG